ncbi:M56 family metallopeptidase [Mycolicibacterium sp.]|uniref:M56 family metallopeptidase n=1 Tax=Mycolicibacterium sp. TaxID=2320850 RepID=UPI003D13DEDE
MLLVFVFLGLAAALLVVSPVVLTAGRWQVRFPRTALTLWFVAFFAGCAAAVASVVAAIVLAIGGGAVLGGEAVVATVIAWLSLAAIGAVIAIIAAASEPLSGVHRQELQTLVPLVSSREQRKGFVLARFSEEAPIACAVRWPERMILVSTGMLGALTPPQVQAVLAHERAHLRGRHDWAMRIAQINAACLPTRLPAGAALRRATALLIELMADDAAARQAGAVNLANALLRMAELTDDASMRLRAERLTLRRWPSVRRVRVPDAVRV